MLALEENMLTLIDIPLAGDLRHLFDDPRLIAYAGLGLIGFLTWRIIYQLILYPRFFSPLRKLPGPPLGNIITGQLLTALRSEPAIPQREWIKEHGPVVRVMGPFGVEVLIFATPAALQKILASDCMDYPRPNFLTDGLSFFAGYGLLTVNGAEHKRMRRLVSPAFSIPNVAAQADMYHEPIEGLLEILQKQLESSESQRKQGGIIHMYEWISKVSLDILCETAFGYTTDSLHNPDNELADAYDKLFSLQCGSSIAIYIAVFSIPGAPTLLTSDWAYKHRYLFKWIPGVGDTVGIAVESMHRIRKIASQILETRLRESAALTSDSEGKRDIISLLIQARGDKQNGESALSDDDMTQQLLTFLTAGHETIAAGLAWTLWNLASDIASQTKLREEVSPFFDDAHARPEYRRLQELSWLDCVIMESLRVLPPLPFGLRTATKTDIIDGVLVPEGTVIGLPIRAVNSLKETWGEDAEEFKPERWLNLPPDGNRMSSFLSFLGGPRACIGKTMAMMVMKAIIAALISRFEFEPAYDGQRAHPTATITMRPGDGLPLRVRAVSKSS